MPAEAKFMVCCSGAYHGVDFVLAFRGATDKWISGGSVSDEATLAFRGFLLDVAYTGLTYERPTSPKRRHLRRIFSIVTANLFVILNVL